MVMILTGLVAGQDGLDRGAVHGVAFGEVDLVKRVAGNPPSSGGLPASRLPLLPELGMTAD
jgi:hypothetical protein